MRCRESVDYTLANNNGFVVEALRLDSDVFAEINYFKFFVDLKRTITNGSHDLLYYDITNR